MVFSKQMIERLEMESFKFLHKGFIYLDFQVENEEVYANEKAARIFFSSDLNRSNVYKLSKLENKLYQSKNNMPEVITSQIEYLKEGILESFSAFLDFGYGSQRVKLSRVASLEDYTKFALVITISDGFYKDDHALQKDLLLRTFESESASSAIGYGFMTLENDNNLKDVYMSRAVKKLLFLKGNEDILVAKSEIKHFEDILNSVNSSTTKRIFNIRKGKYKSFTEIIKIFGDDDLYYREIIITLVEDYSDMFNRSKISYIIKDITDQVKLKEESIEILDVYNMAIYTQYPLKNGFNLYPGRINSYGMFQLPVKQCEDGSICFDDFKNHLELYNSPSVIDRFDKYGAAIMNGEIQYDIMDINLKISARVRLYSIRRSVREVDKNGNVVKILVSFVDVNADFIKVKHLEKQLEIDVLTQIKNRYSLIENHKASCGTLLYVDLDDFKQINDTFGHGEGDIYLQTTAVLLQEYANKVGADVFRIGGDEFIIFTNSIITNEQLKHMCDDLVDSKRQFNASQQYMHEIKFSFGAMSSLNDKMTLDTLLAISDKALYKAKKDKKLGYVIANWY